MYYFKELSCRITALKQWWNVDHLFESPVGKNKVKIYAIFFFNFKSHFSIEKE